VVAHWRNPLLYPAFRRATPASLLASSRPHPATKAAQKYISKKRKILGGEKVSPKHHDSPRNSPQTHHDLPPQNTTKTQKPPANATLHHEKLFS
jgi:hypothetical protein